MSRMSGAASASACGTVRRGFLISPPIRLADSGPAKAKAIAPQKIRSLSPSPGRSAAAVIGVAGPKRHQQERCEEACPGACVAQPLADSEAADVEHRDEGQRSNSERDEPRRRGIE